MFEQIVAVHHVAVIASNYEVSKRFYTQVLGLPVLAETYRAERDSYKLDLALGPHSQLELFSFPKPPPRPTTPEACGLRHLALAVKDVEQAVAVLRGHGVVAEPIRVDALTHKRYTFFKDPDGLPLELYEA
jgi:glyoxylase I family protein